MGNKGNRRLANKKLMRKAPGRSGVLTERDIKRRLGKSVSDVTSLVITPCPDENSYDKDSIDLRLGSYFFVPRSHRTPCFVPGVTNPLHLYTEHYVQLGSYLVLPAHHAVLGATLEYLKMPADVSGEILTKSSWARTFLSIETAPWIHPSYRGCLTLEIANVSNTPVVLYPGFRIAQLVLIKTSASTISQRDTIDGTYIGPVRPEPATLDSPQSAIRDMRQTTDGIRYPFDEYRTQ